MFLERRTYGTLRRYCTVLTPSGNRLLRIHLTYQDGKK